MRFWGIAIFIVSFISISMFMFAKSKDETIKVAILHSFTGTMASSEIAVAKAFELAIKEINQNGGLLGKNIEVIIKDGKSDSLEFGRMSRDIRESGIDTIFGCWTSASRKEVKAVLEELGGVLFYPVQYEGFESSPNIVYLGAVPNQQIAPAINYIKNEIGNSIYLIGSDYIYPRMANSYIKEFSKLIGVTILKESYKPLGAKDFDEIVRDIKLLKPKAIINTINGDSNIPFFRTLKDNGISSKEIPIFSFSIAEDMIKSIDTEAIDGSFVVWSYFNSIKSKSNMDLKEKFKKEYGDDFIVTDPVEVAYYGVKLWEKSVRDGGSANYKTVLNMIKNQSINSPEGILYIEPKTQHTYRALRVGRVNSLLEFETIFETKYPIEPTPYPDFINISEGLELQDSFKNMWDGKWQAEGVKE